MVSTGQEVGVWNITWFGTTAGDRGFFMNIHKTYHNGINVPFSFRYHLWSQ